MQKPCKSFRWEVRACRPCSSACKNNILPGIFDERVDVTVVRVDVAVDALEFPFIICLIFFAFFWTENKFIEQEIHVKHSLSLDVAVRPQLLTLWLSM